MLISNDRVEARKAHRCDMCSRQIDPGEHYWRQALADNGTAWTWRECEHCTVMVTALDVGSYSADGLHHPDLMCDVEARSIAEARMIAMWRHGWRRLDGSLWPVPDMQASPSGAGA